MLTSPPRQRASRPRRRGQLIKSPSANERSAVEARMVAIHTTEEAAGTAEWPTLDDFGGRSDALGG